MPLFASIKRETTKRSESIELNKPEFKKQKNVHMKAREFNSRRPSQTPAYLSSVCHLMGRFQSPDGEIASHKEFWKLYPGTWNSGGMFRGTVSPKRYYFGKSNIIGEIVVLLLHV